MATVSKRRGKWVVDYRDFLGKRVWITCDTKKEADETLSFELHKNNFSEEYLINKISSQIKYVKRGVYFLYQNSTVVYVGLSKNISNRLHNHYSEKQKIFDSYSYIEIPDEIDLYFIESYFINYYKPIYNLDTERHKNCLEKKFRDMKKNQFLRHVFLNDKTILNLVREINDDKYACV